MARLGIHAIEAEVALTHELEAVFELRVGESGLHLRLLNDHGVRVQVIVPVFAFRDLRRIFQREQVIDEAHFGIHSVCCRDPVDGALNLAAIWRFAALAQRVIDAVDYLDLAVCILFDALASDKVSALEADFAFRLQAEVLLRRFFHEVVGFDVELTAERHLTGPCVMDLL